MDPKPVADLQERVTVRKPRGSFLQSRLDRRIPPLVVEGRVGGIYQLEIVGAQQGGPGQHQRVISNPGGPQAAEQGVRDGRGQAVEYGLGRLAWWTLTGTLVFDSDNPLQVVIGHMDRVPGPISERLGQPLPAQLEDLVASCLAKDPARRPSAASVGRALDELAGAFAAG